MNETHPQLLAAETPEAPQSPPASFDPERLSLALIVAAVAAMVAFSWQKWADPVIDFGRELYVPWRLHEGELLYRDVFYPYSPLSPFVNLSWFKLFGVSYRSIVMGNAVILTALLLLLYRLLRGIASLFAATAGMLLVVLVFAFGQYVSVGNYNYLSPYSHEVTHGLVLSLVALTVLWRYFESGSRGALFSAGFSVGLVFLTKYEIFLAVGAAAAAGLAWSWWPSRDGRRLADLALFAAGVPLPFLACWGLLAKELAPGEALRAALGAYPLLLNSEHSANPFFLRSAGLTAPGLALAGMLGWSALFALSLAPAALLGRGETRLDSRLYSAAAFLLPIVTTAAFSPWLPLTQALLPLPLFLAARSLWLVRARSRQESPPPPSRTLELCLHVFALVLLLRIVLAARAFHYGFALAMPGAVLLLLAGIDAAPAWLTSRGFNGRLFRIAACGLLAAFVGSHLSTASRLFGQRSFSVGEGADTLRVDGLGSVVESAVEVVRDRVKPDETLVVLPEGAFVNYVTRRKSSIPLVVFHVTAIALYGERSIVDLLSASPPDHVLAFSRHVRNLHEMGCEVFGEDCGAEIAAWLSRGYAPRVMAVWKGRRFYTLFARIREGAPPFGPPEVIELPTLR